MVPSTVKDSIKASIAATALLDTSGSNTFDSTDRTAASALWVTVNADSGTSAGSKTYLTCNV